MRRCELPGDRTDRAGFVGSRTDWNQLAAAARTYVMSGAWGAAHELLFSAVENVWASSVYPRDALEAIGLFLVACFHLGHSEHLRVGNQHLRHFLEGNEPFSSEGRALAFLCLAQERLNGGDSGGARALVEEVERTATNVGDWTLSYIEMLLAKVEAREGDLRSAERTALRATSLAERAASDALLADALTSLGNVLAIRRDFESAQRVHARAAACYWRSGDMVGRNTALLNRASLLLELGLLHESEELFSDAHRSAVTIGKGMTDLRARIGLGIVSARRGQHHRARQLLLPAWREARRSGLRREEALALEYLAEAGLLSSRWQRRLTQTRVALHLCSKAAFRLAPQGDIALEITIKEAMFQFAQGKRTDAMKTARRASKHARRIGMPLEEAQALRVLGTILAHAGRCHEARRAFEQAHALLVGIGEHLERRVVEAWLDVLDAYLQAHDSRGPSHESTRPTGRALHSACAAEDRRDAPLDGLRHWMDHPLVGPSCWPGRFSLSQLAPHCGETHPQAGEHTPEANEPAACSDSTLHPLWSALGLVTRTPVLVETLRLAETYAPEKIPILILGDTGTGKDLLAKGIHALSGRTGGYVPVNCAAAQSELFAAELFGARKGAYTGAVEHRQGLIREAQGGTLFFDEVADLEREAQGYLLRFLDSGEIRPLGETRHVCVETRIVAATCRDLRGLAAQGRFRKDLYARLAALVLRVPTLRERREDLELLIDMLWTRLGGANSEYRSIFTADVLEELSQRPWPGNVRDLRHVVARAIPLARARGPAAAIEDVLRRAGREWLPGGHGDVASPAAADTNDACPVAESDTLSGSAVPPPASGTRSIHPPHRIMARDLDGRWPRETLMQALDTAKGHVPTAAALLGLSRSQAYRLYRDLRQSDA